MPLVLVLFIFKNNTAQNLISNGSFESYTGISCTYGSFDNYNATPVYHILNNWHTINSCDYFNAICPEGPLPNQYGYNVPVNGFGCQVKKDSNAYVGFIAVQMQSDLKEYFYQQLLNPLQAGKVYCLSFYVSRADRNQYAIHSIGAYFSNTAQSTGSIGYINKTPQIVNQNGFITDTSSWTNIQGCYTATGGENFITIGNFNSNANTDTLFVGTNNPDPNYPSPINYYSYYYVDDITLIDQTTVGVNELGNGESLEVYPNPANDVLNIDIKNFNKENLSIKIVDVIGKEVLKSDYKNQIDISELQKGIYFVAIQQNDKTLGVKKIIKQ